MNLFCAGLTHHTAPVEVREKFALGHGERPRRMVDAVCALEGIEGAVVLSTCNRVEFYVAAPQPEAAFDTLRGLLRNHAGMEAPWTYFDAPRAVRHLFRVASGLDSMVLGETEILGQVKDAYAAAQKFDATNTPLNRLFQHAFRVAKQVRSETLITRGPTSIGSAAVELAGRIFGDLSNRRVLIFGAGDTSERTARALVSRGVRTVLVSNRTLARATRLAEEIGGQALPFDAWPDAFADILICSTASPHPILTRERVIPALRHRAGQPLFIIDLAVPRDVEPSVGQLEGVHLSDIDSLQEIIGQTLTIRRSELARAERLVTDHVGAFVSWLLHRQTSTP